MASRLPRPAIERHNRVSFGQARQEFNGDASCQKQVEFYEKLSQLRNDVIAGAHPRLKLPQAAIEKLKTRDGVAISKASDSTSNGKSQYAGALPVDGSAE